MTYREFYEIINNTVKEFAAKEMDEYNYIAVRFENKERKVGDICECSKHNPDREEERDFPEYDSEEYASLPELNGTCAWHVYNELFDWADQIDASKIDAFKVPSYKNLDDEYCGDCLHAYIIASKYVGSNPDNDEDYGEIILKDPSVIRVIF